MTTKIEMQITATAAALANVTAEMIRKLSDEDLKRFNGIAFSLKDRIATHSRIPAHVKQGTANMIAMLVSEAEWRLEHEEWKRVKGEAK